jgi:transposase
MPISVVCSDRPVMFPPGRDRLVGLSTEIAAVAYQDAACKRLMTVPGVGSIISSAMVAAIGAGDVFSKGRACGASLKHPDLRRLAT